MARRGRRLRRWAAPALLVGLVAALEAAMGCSEILGIQVVQVDETSPAGSSGTQGAGGVGGASSCSIAAEACAACADCAAIVDVDLAAFTAPGKAMVVSGSTQGKSRSTVPAGVECKDASGPERVYAVHAGADGFLTTSLGRGSTTFDSVLYARKDCCATDDPNGRCADSRDGLDDHGYHGGEVISFRVAKGDVWYVFVDGSGGEAGDYTLTLDLSSGARCAGTSWVPIPIEPGSPMTLSGDTKGLGSDGENRCFLNHPEGRGAQSEIVYELRAPKGVGAFDLALNGTFDTVLYARSDCVDSNAGAASELLCQDENAGVGSETVKGLLNAGAPIYVFVDTGSLAAASYDYTLIITPK